jgi:hypothetical protein
MAKTKLDVVTRAHRRLGVLAQDETLTADQIATGGEVLEGLVAELEAVQGLSLSWDADSVPDGVFLPMAYLLAVDLSPEYEVPPRDARARLIAQIRAYELPDDREDRRDMDDDGIITDSEADADARAVYY